METDKLIGRNLKRLRDSRGLSQQELANTVGIKREKISAYERGAGISTKTFEHICEVLKVKSWEFHVNDDTPIIKNEDEKELIELYRKVKAYNIQDQARRLLRLLVRDAERDSR